MKNKIVTVIVLLILALGWLIVRAEVVPQTQQNIKSNFVTGSVPTQDNYFELIDTMFYYIYASYTNAAYSAQQAAKVGPAAINAMGKFGPPSGSSIVTNALWSAVGCTITQTNGSGRGPFRVDVRFLNGFRDTNYIIQVATDQLTNTPSDLFNGMVWTNKTTNSFSFVSGAGNPPSKPWYFYAIGPMP